MSISCCIVIVFIECVKLPVLTSFFYSHRMNDGRKFSVFIFNWVALLFNDGMMWTMETFNVAKSQLRICPKIHCNSIFIHIKKKQTHTTTHTHTHTYTSETINWTISIVINLYLIIGTIDAEYIGKMNFDRLKPNKISFYQLIELHMN